MTPSDMSTRPDLEVDGDASVHLEELVVGQLPPLEALEGIEGLERTSLPIELIGPHLRVSGVLSTAYHRRLSDFINHNLGLLHIRGATILRRNGEPTRVTTPSLWASPSEVTLIAQTDEEAVTQHQAGDLIVPKVSHTLVIVTEGHTLTGDVHITEGAELAVFIESPDPPFIPMTDVRTRSLADRRIIARYPFALLNRRHVVAATELQPGMIPGRRVL